MYILNKIKNIYFINKKYGMIRPDLKTKAYDNVESYKV